MAVLLYLCCQLINSLSFDSIVFGFIDEPEYKGLDFASEHRDFSLQSVLSDRQTGKAPFSQYNIERRS